MDTGNDAFVMDEAGAHSFWNWNSEGYRNDRGRLQMSHTRLQQQEFFYTRLFDHSSLLTGFETFSIAR